MRLIVAHRILIGTAIAFGLFFTAWGVVRYMRTGQGIHLLIAVVAAVITLGLGYYLRNLKRFVGLPESQSPPASRSSGEHRGRGF